MKKKFVLTLALVLMVAVSLSAATPLEVSGSFSAGYTFTFDSAKTPTGVDGDNKAKINAAFAGDFWSLEIGGNLQYGNKALTAATAKIFLDKALAEEGVDMGDVSLTLHVGTGVGKGAPSVLADKNEYRKGKGVGMTKTDNFGLTIGYADMVEVYFSMFPNKDFPMVVGAKVTPLDGVSVALGFSNDYTAATNKAFAVSAKADVAALADLDFDLAVTGEYLMDLDADLSLINADVTGAYEGIGLWVAFNTDLTTHKLAAKASYETVLEGVTLGGGVKFTAGDLSDIGNSYDVEIDAGASYVLGGVTYALDLGYGVQAKAFTLSPSVAISF